MVGERYTSWEGPEPLRDRDKAEVERWLNAGFEKAKEDEESEVSIRPPYDIWEGGGDEEGPE